MLVPEYRQGERKCSVCDNKFVPYRPQQVYCSPKCQKVIYNKEHDIASQMKRMRSLRKKASKKELRIKAKSQKQMRKDIEARVK